MPDKPDDCAPLGIDRNVGNVSTPHMVIEKPQRVLDEEAKLEKNIKHATARDEPPAGSEPQGAHARLEQV